MCCFAYLTVNLIQRHWLTLVVQQRLTIFAFPILLIFFWSSNRLNLLGLAKGLQQNAKLLIGDYFGIWDPEKFRRDEGFYWRRKSIFGIVKSWLLFEVLCHIFRSVLFGFVQISDKRMGVVEFMSFFAHLLENSISFWLNLRLDLENINF